MRRFLPHLLTLVILGLFFLPFVWRYAKGVSASTKSDKNSPNGTWIGVVDVQSLANKEVLPAREFQGNTAVRLEIHPDYLAYLDKLSGKGEMRDSTGITKKFSIKNARLLNSGRITGTLLGSDGDDTLQGELNAFLETDRLSLRRSTTSEYQINGVLRKGTDEDFESLYKKLTRTRP